MSVLVIFVIIRLGLLVFGLIWVCGILSNWGVIFLLLNVMVLFIILYFGCVNVIVFVRMFWKGLVGVFIVFGVLIGFIVVLLKLIV